MKNKRYGIPFYLRTREQYAQIAVDAGFTIEATATDLNQDMLTYALVTQEISL